MEQKGRVIISVIAVIVVVIKKLVNSDPKLLSL